MADNHSHGTITDHQDIPMSLSTFRKLGGSSRRACIRSGLFGPGAL